ncbi:PA2778 family cysteine peptidase [Halomonas sp. TRM85114]|uniref:PA2778 family cysteine peptidase n=1 Tax=Halomonas jincaotanensis TaxID=2810616 RepID=UPI001BD4CAB6|nr:PA2778 family cysteine peptidase [Halomonas jincaotanensis]MBS9404240.1 PA2778 family cysteine peptidase [Halomonas jincaotanensis]
MLTSRVWYLENARTAGVLVLRKRLRKIPGLRFAGLCLVLLLLTGCAATPQLADTTQQRLPERLLLDDVPFHGQRDYQCGPAALAMVLNAQGVEVSVDALIPQVFLPGREGSVQPEMLATVRRHGRIPFVIEGNLDTLLTEIAAGQPVVVMQNLSLPAWPLWHYAVAIGFDLETDELILHSGETPQRIESFKRFDATWARSDRWAFVTLAPGKLPETINEDTAIEATTAWERLQGAEASLPAWNAIVERFPGTAMGYFALGNARHAVGDDGGAIHAFEQAVANDPNLAVGWLNLGLLHRARGENSQARRAMQQAADLPGKWQAHAEDALNRL